MLAILLAFVFPLLTSSCFCPSCGCSCCSGYNNYYSGGAAGYGGSFQPYNVFYAQPIPVGRGFEARAPIYQQTLPTQSQQYLPPLQPLPRLAQYTSVQNIPQYLPQRPTYVQAPQLLTAPSAPQIPVVSSPTSAVSVPQSFNTYEQPTVSKTNLGYQPSRPVQTLSRSNRPVAASLSETTVAPYTGTTKIVPAKQGKNKDYEYYYVYYDDDGKKIPGTKKPLHDGSIQQRATSQPPQNNIDEYDFDDAKNAEEQVSVTTVATTTTEIIPNFVKNSSPPPPEVTTTEFTEPLGEVHSVQESTTILTSIAPVQAPTITPKPDIDLDTVKSVVTTTPTVTTTAGVEIVTFETAPSTTTETTTRPSSTESAVTTNKPAATDKEDSKNYEYEEYEVEEIQLVNENGVTETVTRIITTTKAPPKKN